MPFYIFFTIIDRKYNHFMVNADEMYFFAATAVILRSEADCPNHGPRTIYQCTDSLLCYRFMHGYRATH